ncbi:UspA domain-containing protein (plasmid) [Cupriavidus necator]|uniref:universal stress protein n=1 Tax=Cupriavidus necator TaxID=106590 RepID=UPI003F73322D
MAAFHPLSLICAQRYNQQVPMQRRAKREEATLFQHLLVPTGGWAPSEGAVRVAVQLAKAIQAKLTCLHVIPEDRVFSHCIDMLEDTRERYAQLAEQQRGAVSADCVLAGHD